MEHFFPVGGRPGRGHPIGEKNSWIEIFKKDI
jgi:hypothetical protein